MNNTPASTKDLEQEWDRLMWHLMGSTPYPVWKYLQGQNVEALVNRREQFLKNIKPVSSLDEKETQIAFAVRDCAGKLVNILRLKLDGLVLLANVGKHYQLTSDASIAGTHDAGDFTCHTGLFCYDCFHTDLF